MKRKVIKLAHKTLVVSLPSKWAKKHGVQKGDEIDINEDGNSLKINVDSKKEHSKISIDISEANERTARWLLSSVHKKGYDEVEVKYETAKQAELVQELVRDLFVGAAIVHQTEHTCIIRNVSMEQKESFDSVLRRAFLVTLNLSEQSLSIAKTGKHNGARNLLSLEKTNNQLTNFCQRILNKYHHANGAFLYVIIWNLEKIADEYKYICKELADKKGQNSEKTLELYSRTNELVRSYYELFYKFDVKQLSKLADTNRQIRAELKEHIEKEPKDARITSHLFNIAMKTADFSASTVAIHQN